MASAGYFESKYRTKMSNLQKAAPKHWFASGKTISISRCPTRFGSVSWKTEALSSRRWKTTVDIPNGFRGDLVLHIHPEDQKPIVHASIGTVAEQSVTLSKDILATAARFEIEIS
jgi:hypothetical protein